MCDLAERAARHRGVDHLHVNTAERRAARFAHVTRDDESVREERIDSGDVGIGNDRGGGLERRLVVPPLSDVARTRRRATEHPEDDLHDPAGRHADLVVALRVGLSATDELAALPRSLQRVHLEAGHCDRAIAVRDVPADDDGSHEVGIDRRLIGGRIDGVGVVEEGLVVPPLLDVPPVRSGAEEHADVGAERHNDRVVPVGVAASERERLAATGVGVVGVDADPADRLRGPSFAHVALDERAGDEHEVLVGRVGRSDHDVGRAVEVHGPPGNAVPPLLPQVRARLRIRLDAVGAATHGDLEVACRVSASAAHALTAERPSAAEARAHEDVRDRTTRSCDRPSDEESGLELRVDVVLVRARRHRVG